MNRSLVFFALLAFGTAYAAPLVFNEHLLREGERRLSVLHHVTFREGEDRRDDVPADPRVLRFLVLVPRLAAVPDLTDGFASQARGMAARRHEDLRLDPVVDGVLTDLAGLSDCRLWAGLLVGAWGPGGRLHRGHTYLKVDGKFKHEAHVTVDPVVKFLHDRVAVRPFRELLRGLLKKGLPAHLLTHRLLAHENLEAHLDRP